MAAPAVAPTERLTAGLRLELSCVRGAAYGQYGPHSSKPSRSVLTEEDGTKKNDLKPALDQHISVMAQRRACKPQCVPLNNPEFFDANVPYSYWPLS